MTLRRIAFGSATWFALLGLALQACAWRDLLPRPTADALGCVLVWVIVVAVAVGRMSAARGVRQS